MTTYKVTVPTHKKADGKWDKIPSLNDFIRAERTTIRSRNGRLLTKGAIMKRQWQDYMSVYIRKDLKRTKIDGEIILHYYMYEADHKRDWSNCFSTFVKFFEDSLQECGVIKNDNQKVIKGFTAHFDVDKTHPRTEVVIEEVN